MSQNGCNLLQEKKGLEMKRAEILLFLLCLGGSESVVRAENPELKIFGYFQNEFEYRTTTRAEVGGISHAVENENSFLVQQLNVFLQRDLVRDWTSFVNFEVLNSYSSIRSWGGFNLEEAWVKYRAGRKFSLKLGLQIPLFNNLNEIKNRTPLLPYIVRPLVYETSFNDEISLEEFVPARTFVQAYGFIPYGGVKIDYAAYLGNSQNINNQSDSGQTGIDTTTKVLVGGRIGVRLDELKAGLSATYDNLNFPQWLADSLISAVEQISVAEFAGGSPGPRVTPADFKKVPRVRLGGDFSSHFSGFSFAAEFIRIRYDDDIEAVDFDKEFYYGTLGYHFTEQLFAYASYWSTEENYLPAFAVEVKVPTIGASYNLNDSIVLKAQYAPVDVEHVSKSARPTEEFEFNFYAAAVSAIF